MMGWYLSLLHAVSNLVSPQGAGYVQVSSKSGSRLSIRLRPRRAGHTSVGCPHWHMWESKVGPAVSSALAAWQVNFVYRPLHAIPLPHLAAPSIIGRGCMDL